MRTLALIYIFTILGIALLANVWASLRKPQQTGDRVIPTILNLIMVFAVIYVANTDGN